MDVPIKKEHLDWAINFIAEMPVDIEYPDPVPCEEQVHLTWRNSDYYFIVALDTGKFNWVCAVLKDGVRLEGDSVESLFQKLRECEFTRIKPKKAATLVETVEALSAGFLVEINGYDYYLDLDGEIREGSDEGGAGRIVISHKDFTRNWNEIIKKHNND
jgi:hypothetical protein